MIRAEALTYMYESQNIYIPQYFPQYDRRRIIEYLARDIIELASMNLPENEMIKPKHIKYVLNDDNQIKQLLSK